MTSRCFSDPLQALSGPEIMHRARIQRLCAYNACRETECVELGFCVCRHRACRDSACRVHGCCAAPSPGNSSTDSTEVSPHPALTLAIHGLAALMLLLGP